MKLTLPQLVALAQKHGFPDPELAAAIAMAESHGDTQIPNYTLGQRVLPHGTLPENSIGLWQINKVNSQACTWNESTGMWDCPATKYASWDLTDPDVNAQAAYEITQRGTNWRGPYYSTVVTYRSYLPYYRPAASDFSQVTPPLARPSDAPVAVLGVALLAAVAGYVASERARFA